MGSAARRICLRLACHSGPRLSSAARVGRRCCCSCSLDRIGLNAAARLQCDPVAPGCCLAIAIGCTSRVRRGGGAPHGASCGDLRWSLLQTLRRCLALRRWVRTPVHRVVRLVLVLRVFVRGSTSALSGRGMVRIRRRAAVELCLGLVEARIVPLAARFRRVSRLGRKRQYQLRRLKSVRVHAGAWRLAGFHEGSERVTQVGGRRWR